MNFISTVKVPKDMVNFCTNRKLIDDFGPKYDDVVTTHAIYNIKKKEVELVYEDKSVMLELHNASYFEPLKSYC